MTAFGELLALVERDQGRKGQARTTGVDAGRSGGIESAYDEAEITHQTGQRWQTIATLPEERYRGLSSATIVIDLQARARAQAPPLP